jgi:hypothetical protein
VPLIGVPALDLAGRSHLEPLRRAAIAFHLRHTQLPSGDAKSKKTPPFFLINEMASS